MKNPKLLQQLALAKQAGSQAMAKNFFAKTPSPGAEDEAAEHPEPDADQAGGPSDMDADNQAGGEQLTPEQLEEILRALESQGGGTQG